MKNINIKSRKGFTLIEVMTALAIFSMTVPLVLSGVLFYTKAINSGIQKSNNISDYRLFEQRFARYIMNSQRQAIRPTGGSANTIVFNKFDSGSGSWVNEFVRFSPSDNELIYYPLGSANDKRVVLHNAYPTSGSADIFSISNGNVSCDLLIGENKRHQVPMSISVTPRN